MRKCEVGGQAVIEGVMMRGNKGQATAIRKSDGKIEIDMKKIVPITKKYKFLNIPFIRGIFVLIDSLVTGINTLNYSASFFEEDEEESKFELWLKNKFGDKSNDLIVGGTMVLSFALAIGLFVALPTSIASLFAALNLNPVLLNLIEAIIRIVILLIYMYSISKMDDIYRVFQYHGAEHKSIFCYEADEELTVENVRKFPRFHPRCGTNFLFLIMFVSIIIFSFTGWGGFFERLLLRIVLIPIVSGITYELIRWIGKSENILSKVIAYPGLKLQELTTKEPDDDQLEVAIAALMTAEGIKAKEKTIGELLELGSKKLKEKSIDSYMLDAQLLLGMVLGKDKIYVITNRDKEVSHKDEKEYKGDINKNDLIVFYDVSTKSIPAQTTPTKVVVLGENEIALKQIEAAKNATPAPTASPKVTEAPQVSYAGLVNVVIGDKNVSDVYAKDNTTMVPLREVAEAAGFTVTWDAENRAVILNDGVYSLKIGENSYVKGKMMPLTLSAAPEIVNDLTYVPAEFFAEVTESATVDGTSLVVTAK